MCPLEDPGVLWLTAPPCLLNLNMHAKRHGTEMLADTCHPQGWGISMRGGLAMTWSLLPSCSSR